MSELLARIEAHFRPDDERRLEVAEWGQDGKPLIITYKPVTLEDQSVVNSLANGDAYMKGAHLVALKARDENGERLFRQSDAIALKTRADPIVIARISAQMLGGLTVEQARKN